MTAPVLSRLFVTQRSSEEHPQSSQTVHASAAAAALHRPGELRTSTTNPQSHSFSRSYGTILPTSLSHLTLLTRGCSPRRPDAVMGTGGCEIETSSRFFKDCRIRTRCPVTRSTLPDCEPSLPASCFQGPKLLNRNDNTPWGIRQWHRVNCVAIQYPHPDGEILFTFPFTVCDNAALRRATLPFRTD